MIRPIAVGLMSLALATGGLAAQKEAPPAAGIPKPYRVPPRRSITLPNGMKVTLVPYGSIPKMAVSLSIATGTIDEQPDQVQLSSLVASMLLEGTTSKSAADISRGAAEMGGTLTANSDDDEVTVGGELLSEHGERYIALLADVVLHPRFAEADVARLGQNLVRDNAIGMQQPGQVARVKFRATLFGDHPYGRVIAPDSMVRSYKAATVRRFYSANYGARRAHLYISGVFDAARMERAIRLAFGRWAGGPAATIHPPIITARRQVELVDRAAAVQSTIRMGVPVADPTNPDFIQLSVADALLGGSFASRITSNIREDKGYTYSPGSFVATWPRVGVWAEVADVTTDVTGASLKEIFGEIDRLRNEAPPAPELTGIKNGLAGQFIIQNSSRYGLIGRLQFVDQYGLGDQYLSNYVSNVMGVTPEQVQQVARKYLDPSKMLITVVGDKKTVEAQIAPYRGATP
ncbi:MAG TPA: pitrilysin family protein [Gemmatimonadales bacterium]|nr:pitrilysin family protein [Gemmatimonadales bacterium]